MSSDINIYIPECDEKNKKPKSISLRIRISNHISEFMQNSSIHGFKYLAGSNRTIFEKILWLVVLVFSVYTCSIWIQSTWKKWEENPTFIGFGQTPVRVWEIPFPTVTVCPDVNFYRNSNHTFSYIVNKENWIIGNVSTYCEGSERGTDSYFTEFDFVDFYEGPKWETFLLKTAIPSERLFGSAHVNFKKKVRFSPIFTKSGVCYSFNMLDKSDLFHNDTAIPKSFGNQHKVAYWSFEKNYQITDEAVYPERFKTVQHVLYLWLESKLHKLTCYNINKYFIKLHHSGEIPHTTQAITIENNKLYNILIKPEITIASESLRTYAPHRKKCFYSDERHLQFYKIYTQENCKSECLANNTLNNCGCVPAYLPHNRATKLCGKLSNTSLSCMKLSEENMLEMESGLRQNLSNLLLCNCLPSCNLIIYNSEVGIENAPFDDPYVQIRFKDAEYTVLERQELFGDVNFWASCGGILGLFTGFSFVSLAEIIYYFFFRWLYNWCKRLWERVYSNTFMITLFE